MGLLDKIKGAFSSSANNKKQSFFEDIIQQANAEIIKKGLNWYTKDIKSTEIYKRAAVELSDNDRVDFLLFLVQQIYLYTTDSKTTISYKIREIYEGFLTLPFEKPLTITEAQTEKIIHAFITKRISQYSLYPWPLLNFISALNKQYSYYNPDSIIPAELEKLKSAITNNGKTENKETASLSGKIDQLIYTIKNKDSNVVLFKFYGSDDFSINANKLLDSIDESKKTKWSSLLEFACTANGAKPSAKFLQVSKKQIDDVGVNEFKKITLQLFESIQPWQSKHEFINRTTAQTQTQIIQEFLNEAHYDCIKGLIWMCSHFHDTQTLAVVAALTERCFKKIPGKGPAAVAVGNAGLYTLYKSKGLEGIGHLSRLKLRIKQNSTQKIIEKYLLLAAKEQGVSIYEIEDIAVDDYKLVDGQTEWDFDGYKAVVSIVAVGKTQTKWYKPDGSEQKAAPAAVKEKQAAKLKKLTATTKAIEATLTAQRDRIDRLLRIDRQMTWEHFNTYYLQHGLMGFLTKKIIWNFKTEETVKPVIYFNGTWVDSAGKSINPTEKTMVSLWHPATATVGEVKTWREFLIANTIQQPIKQAFREVYLLTEAELNTRSYSNRMAAHVLRQHQFNSLAKTRGWRYALMGNWDGGGGGADLNLPEYNLHAEYWVNEVNADDQFNDSGIWNYVATDQVRFVSTTTSEVVDLINVPPIIFSEVMRDVDLFVGVASVGNDPTWSDTGGLPTYRDYWQSYSFGDLTEIAKSRKELLTRLLPRLKISKIAEIRDKFLVVKGKLRTYKIHIGSTNILMEPNDQYLCIVPDRSKNKTSESLFLPFEGDAGLSIILSKAFLLADDDKITDTTITSQINRK
jgi:hypothetical protein